MLGIVKPVLLENPPRGLKSAVLLGVVSRVSGLDEALVARQASKVG
jgi:hypothetical protein